MSISDDIIFCQGIKLVPFKLHYVFRFAAIPSSQEIIFTAVISLWARYIIVAKNYAGHGLGLGVSPGFKNNSYFSLKKDVIQNRMQRKKLLKVKNKKVLFSVFL
jgi:hypothetical protein